MQLLRLKSDVPYNPYEETNPNVCSKAEERRNPIVGATQILGGMVTLSVRLIAGTVMALVLILVVAVLLKFLLL